MAFKTWEIRVGGKTVRVKGAAKADVSALERKMEQFVQHMHEFTKELWGTIGVDESSAITQSFTLGFRGEEKEPLPTEAEYQLDRTIYLAELPEVITNVPAELAKVKTLFNKHLKVVDKRVTPAVKDAQRINNAKAHEEQEAARLRETHEWLDARGISHDLIPIPEGMMAIYLQVTFNDSHVQADYFNRHAPLGEKLLLALVPKKAETEKVARAAVARYPELLAHKWEWHTEKWAMGHGNYLTTEYFGTEKHRAYDGREEVATRYEVGFTDCHSKSMYAYKGYPGGAVAPASSSAAV